MKDLKNCKDDSQFVIALDGLDLTDDQKQGLNKELQKTVMHFLADNVKAPVVISPRSGQRNQDFGFIWDRPFIWGIIIEDWHFNINKLKNGLEQIG